MRTTHLFSLLIISLLLISTGSTVAHASVTVFQQGVNGYSGGEDTELSDDYPTTNFSTGGSLYTNREAVRFCDTKCNKILLRFKSLGITGPITNVKLELKESGQQGGSNYIYAHKVSRPDWVNLEATWNNYKAGSSWTSSGGDAGASLVTASAPGSESWLTLDLGGSWTAAELEQNGILIDADIPGYNYAWFYSNESGVATDRPKLTVTYGTSGSTDTTPPSVSVSSPVSGATLSGASVSLTANASDNIGVAGVQFKVDGSSVGSEDTSSPYTATINTTAYTNGSHSISATARDAAGNKTTSSSVSVTVNNTVVAPAPTVTISASSTSVASGSSSTLTWSSTNATSCVASGAWTGTKSTSGSQSTGALTANSTFTISCTGSGGTSSQSVAVNMAVTPSGSGLNIDLSYVNQSSTAFSRLKTLVDNAIAGNPDYGFSADKAALIYKITGDTRYADFAIQWVETCPNSFERRNYGERCGLVEEEATINAGGIPRVASDSYLEVGDIVGAMSLVYDWANARLTTSQKTRWANYANQAIYNVWNPNQASWGGVSHTWSGWSINNPGNNYYYSFVQASMYWALASHDSTLLSFVRNQKLQPLMNYFAQLPGGGSLEGTGYGAAHMRMFHLYQVWKDSTGEDIANANSHLTDSIRFWVNATTPNRAFYAPIGDLSRESFPNLFDYHRRLMLEANRLTNNATAKDLASWWLQHISVTQMSRAVDAQWDLLPQGSYSGALPNEPLAYRATGVGRVFARTGWDTNALWMTFVAGKYNESHAHQDQGSFDLANNGWLAVSNNIFSASGIEQSTDYHNVLRFVQNGSIIPQREGTESTMTVNQLAANGDVDVTGNLTAAYGGNSAVQNWTRNVKFMGRKLTVTDNFSVGSGTQAVFQLDVPVQPTINGNSITAGGLYARVLSPATPAIQVVSQGRYRIDISGGTTGYVVELSDQPFGAPTAINGMCGAANGVPVASAPTANLCSSGTASGVSGNGPWSWSCVGSNGGTTASCVAPIGSTTDTQTPSVPLGLSATPVSNTQINLAWNASTDNVGVSGYKLYRDGILLVTLGNVTSYQNTGLASATPYSYTVASYDAAGNTSLQSSAVSATTLNVPPPTPTTFAVGARVKASTKLNVRTGPSTSYRALCTQSTGSTGTIIAGPTKGNGYIWWQTNFDSGCDGWTAEKYLALATLTITPINQTLVVGAKGEDVAALQRLFTTLGFFKENVTGYFGQLTKEAVTKFQVANGITAAGVVGPQTRSFLQKLMGW